MLLHEYQGKSLLRQFGIKVPVGYLIESHQDIEAYAQKIKTEHAILKAQIHTPNRRELGGVQVVSSVLEAMRVGRAMLGRTYGTSDYGAMSRSIRKIYIEEYLAVQKTGYLACEIDYNRAQLRIVAARAGGVPIEALRQTSPESICVLHIDPVLGVKQHQIQLLAKFFELESHRLYALEKVIRAMLACFESKDLTHLEINPWALTEADDFVALNCKISVDENALYRQPELEVLRDFGEEDPRVIEASAYGMTFTPLKGEIACLVNGSGLAKATIDAVKMAGGGVSNCLDVGCCTCEEMISKAIEMIRADGMTKVLYINVFGGVIQCDVIAKALIELALSDQIRMPVVVKMAGNRAEVAKYMLANSGFGFTLVDQVDEGASLAVQLEGMKKVS